jgi:hypothetical protein
LGPSSQFSHSQLEEEGLPSYDAGMLRQSAGFALDEVRGVLADLKMEEDQEIA